jgi:hypothetical protein
LVTSSKSGGGKADQFHLCSTSFSQPPLSEFCKGSLVTLATQMIH